jgi:hypothetical protein
MEEKSFRSEQKRIVMQIKGVPIGIDFWVKWNCIDCWKKVKIFKNCLKFRKCGCQLCIFWRNSNLRMQSLLNRESRTGERSLLFGERSILTYADWKQEEAKRTFTYYPDYHKSHLEVPIRQNAPLRNCFPQIKTRFTFVWPQIQIWAAIHKLIK